MKSYYSILGIENDATSEEIKKSYRDLSKVNHPDKGGNPEAFNSINEAYENLIDPEKREYYDKHGQALNNKDSLSKIIGIAIYIFKKASAGNPGDIFQEINEIYEHSKEDLYRESGNAERQKENTAIILARIKKIPKNDFIGFVLNNDIKNLEIQIENFNNEIESLEKAFELLKSYEFSIEEKSRSGSNWGRPLDNYFT